jgi:predicted dehydrogenase
MHEAARFTILGSGFGLYGYLPALLNLGRAVALPQRYKPVLGGRSELLQFMPSVDWCEDADAALARSNAAIVALRPADQARWVSRLAQMQKIRTLILEKPVAPTPELSASLLDELARAGKHYRIGYTFRLLPWAQQLRATLGGDADGISLDWTFLAHHYRNDLANWKRFDAEGGGALRFYGIHLVALLAELGYDDVSTSTLWQPSDAETQRWEATFTGPALCPFTVNVDSRAGAVLFRIAVKSGEQVQEALVDQPDPFSAEHATSPQGQDIRVGVLERLCRSLEEADEAHAELQRAIVRLWARIEGVSGRRSTMVQPTAF